MVHRPAERTDHALTDNRATKAAADRNDRENQRHRPHDPPRPQLSLSLD